MSKNGQKVSKDAYVTYAEELLRSTPGLWSKYSNKTPHNHVYRREGTKIIEVISYKRYKAIIYSYFKEAKGYIIDGYALSLGHNLGRIAGRRVERNFANKQVNWPVTEEMWRKKGERKGLVYYLDEDWIRISWTKTNKVRNLFLYKFRPAAGNIKGTGFRKEFTTANQKNPLLKYRYAYYPYVKQEVE